MKLCVHRGLDSAHNPVVDVAEHFFLRGIAGLLVDPRTDLHAGSVEHPAGIHEVDDFDIGTGVGCRQQQPASAQPAEPCQRLVDL